MPAGLRRRPKSSPTNENACAAAPRRQRRTETPAPQPKTFPIAAGAAHRRHPARPAKHLAPYDPGASPVGDARGAEPGVTGAETALLLRMTQVFEQHCENALSMSLPNQ